MGQRRSGSPGLGLVLGRTDWRALPLERSAPCRARRSGPVGRTRPPLAAGGRANGGATRDRTGEPGAQSPGQEGTAKYAEALVWLDGVCRPPRGADGQQHRRARPTHPRRRAQELLRFRQSVVGRTRGDDVQPADDDALVGDQSPHVADGVSGSLRGEWPPAAGALECLSALGHGGRPAGADASGHDQADPIDSS